MGARHRSLRQIQPAHTRLKREKKGKLGCESGKERGERRRREEQDKEEEEKKREEEGAEHPMHAPTGAQIKK